MAFFTIHICIMTLCEHINSMTYIAYLVMKNSELRKYNALKLMKICVINTPGRKITIKTENYFHFQKEDANNF